MQQKINGFEVSPEHLISFLTLHFNRGSSYGTLNSYRSAISQITKFDISQDFRLKRFFKGVYGLRPNTPKYDTIWDPSVVLNYIEQLKNETLSLQEITCKLTVLLLLSTGQRLQTITNIELCNIISTPDGINIKIPKRLKTSGINKTQPNITLPYFKEKPNLCVAQTIKTYINKTASLRGPQSNHLIITFKAPYKNASSQTLSRWVKTTLKKCGIDTTVFTAYSTRHAATSAAARKGASIDTIRCSAGWSSRSNMFALFYHRQIKDNNFAPLVLSSTSKFLLLFLFFCEFYIKLRMLTYQLFSLRKNNIVLILTCWFCFV